MVRSYAHSRPPTRRGSTGSSRDPPVLLAAHATPTRWPAQGEGHRRGDVASVPPVLALAGCTAELHRGGGALGTLEAGGAVPGSAAVSGVSSGLRSAGPQAPVRGGALALLTSWSSHPPCSWRGSEGIMRRIPSWGP